MSYQDELEYLYSLHQFGIKLGLSNIRDLCALSGNPQERIKTVHVGGTNGKGSTAAVLSSILQAAGYKVGLYTSPHLTDFTERIRIHNIPIPKERVAGLVKNVRKCVGDRDIMPTFFELTTALALSYFAEELVDIAVMEVGMGGRLDATNIINPLVSVITHVGYDHMEHLGASLEEIAIEKCGIIKRGVPVITSESKGHILSIIEESAGEADAMPHVYGREFYAEPVRMTPYYSEFWYHGLQWGGLLLKTPLAGRHQMFNMGAALCAAELLTGMGFDITERQAAEGVRNVSWPGRLERVSDKPQVFLDGAHNHDGAVALRRFIEDVLMAQRAHGKIVLIFGVLKDKDAGAMIGELIPCSTEVIITSPDTERGLPVEVLREIVEKQGIKPHVTRTISGALSLAHDIASSSDTIIVTGSLYVVGEARALISAKLVSG
ncbi:MAG: bifunctional folylpolyglutamate synthase/dihydrofolate synthase [Nitrospirae bacterium]|nr:bifunctional folylpolyglutamate synthase/dihydrofolate synthase [Nitrospirota bacterium]